MAKKYVIEKEGQLDFFKDLGINVSKDDLLIEHTDGVYKGSIFEFKLSISDLSKVLFQAIKYLSNLRINGRNVGKHIILVDLNKRFAYVYDSNDFYDEIHTVYTGSASLNNLGFDDKDVEPEIFDYSKATDMDKLKKVINDEKYIKITINEDCIVGWGERYYSENPKASKGDFLGDYDGQVKITGEIREPKVFKDFIKPYTGKSNEKFKYLMDKLNDRLNKKDLGAFYTPVEYCELAAKLLRKAINKVPAGNDYIILDRCAGTGNLEAVLNEDELSHVIVATYEYYEYKVLYERIGNKVRHIVPPTESTAIYSKGYILNADALSKDFIDNEVIKKYVDNPKCTIILYENPPFRDDTSGMTKIKSSNRRNVSYVLKKMLEENVDKSNEIGNRFIWSAFKYYIRQKNDAYIVFSPIKYWKLDNLVNRKFNGGFIFNRKHFHASSPSATSCIYWGFEEQNKNQLSLKAYDIINGKAKYIKDVVVTKCYNEISKIFDKTKPNGNLTKYYCSTNGDLYIGDSSKSYIDDSTIGYFVGRGFGISNPNLNLNLVRLTFSDFHGFWLKRNNYMIYMPIVAIKHHLMFCRDWTEVELLCCSTDKGFAYTKDKDFIKKCFIFGCLDYYNKCRSLTLPNGKVILNELCFDRNTIANKDLKKMSLSKEEEYLIDLFKRVLKEAKKTKKYNSKYSYGLYQIDVELNEHHKDEDGNTIYEYPKLNSAINTLRDYTSKYYDKNIRTKMFKYELIK